MSENGGKAGNGKIIPQMLFLDLPLFLAQGKGEMIHLPSPKKNATSMGF